MKSSDDKTNLYVKRGEAKRRRTSLLEEAIGAIKTMSHESHGSDNDSADHFGNFVAARLREMSPNSRKRCEHEIMKNLINY